MDFIITGRHINVTEAIKTYAEEKTSKLPRYYNSINQVKVIIDGKEHNDINVEIIARGEHNKVFVAEETSKDAYKAIDIVVRKLERQLRRIKSKERNNKHLTG
ncbi:MAG: ribosome hibernation-promoting factor, HPF/YfiA family [Planctomycetota bacterium]